MKKLFSDKDRQYLAKSILLEEAGVPRVEKFVIYFTVTIIVSFIIWANFIQINEVAVAVGEIVPVQRVYKIEHESGGTISKIFKKDGDLVEKGTPLLELDKRTILSNLEQAKLQRDNFDVKKVYLDKQVKMRKKLVAKGLNSKISFLNYKSQYDDIVGKIKEQDEIIHRYSEDLNEMLIVSPISGTIHGLKTYTIGRVVAPGESILEVVPKDRTFYAEVQINSKDIGHVGQGDVTTLKFTTYDFTRYGGIKGKLKEISPSTLLTPRGEPYYKGVVSFKETYLKRGGVELPILPGMTVQAEIKTGEKSIIEYLLKPIYASAAQALHER